MEIKMANTAFVGNDDFRGYLAALSSGPGGMDANASRALAAEVGNDGGYDPNRLNSYFDSPDSGDRTAELNSLVDWTKNAYSQWSGGGGSVLGTNTTSDATRSPAYSQEDMDYLTNQESLYNTLKNSLGGTLQSGLSKLDTSEQGARGSAKLSNDRAMRDYGIRREDSKRGKQDAIGSVDSNARSLSDSVRRILGMASGSGSSAYQFAAPNAVARDASKKRSSVMNNYGTNERNLDLAVGDTEVDYGNLLNEITNKRRTEEESLRAGVLGQEQQITNSLGEIASERARLQGGNTLNAMRPYQDRYLGIQNEIGALPNKFAVTNPREVKVTQPKLSDYLVDKTAINASNQSGQTQYSPYLAFLNRQRDDEEQLAVA
jgi:hypothetical protein